MPQYDQLQYLYQVDSNGSEQNRNLKGEENTRLVGFVAYMPIIRVNQDVNSISKPQIGSLCHFCQATFPMEILIC